MEDGVDELGGNDPVVADGCGEGVDRGVQNAIPSQQPRSRLRWLSKSIEVPSGMMPLTTFGARMAMRAAIQPPCEVPRTKASGMSSASSTWRFAIAESQ